MTTIDQGDMMRLIIPNLPDGVRFDSRGLVFDLSDEGTVAMLKATFYQIQVLENNTPYSEQPEITTVDPQVTRLISQIFKDTK